MDEGVFALLFGIGALWLLDAIPERWRHAAGGLLILLTVLLIAMQLGALAFS